MFKDKDVICFYGDSITANGTYVAEFYQEAKKRTDVKCFNCGISGATSSKAVKYLYSNCLIYNPDYVFLCYGVNDIGRYFRSKAFSGTSEQAEERIKTLKRYHRESYEILIKAIRDFGAEPIFVSCPPYDEINDLPGENLKIQADLLDVINDVRKIAENLNCRVIDASSPLWELMHKKVIHNGDRIHLNKEGHHAFAQILLKECGIIKEPDFESEFVMEEWNAMRYEIEHKHTMMSFVAFCVTDNGGVAEGTLEDKKNYIRSLLEKNPPGELAEAYEYYLKNVDFYYLWRAETLRLTK